MNIGYVPRITFTYTLAYVHMNILVLSKENRFEKWKSIFVVL